MEVPAERVVRVDHDERVEEAGHDQEGVAVLVADRADIAGAKTDCARDEIGDADAEMGQGGERHQRLRDVEREQSSVNTKTNGEHERNRDEKRETFEAAPLPEVTGARDGPGDKTQQHDAARLRFFCAG